MMRSSNLSAIKSASIALLVACVAMLFGCSPKPTPQEDLQSETRYYISALFPGAFSYSNNQPISLDNAGVESYLSFENDFKSIKIGLDKGGSFEYINLIITGFTQKDGNVNGTAQWIDKTGQLITYKLTSDQNQIYLKSTVTHQIYTDANVDAENADPLTAKTITSNTLVAAFLRQIPPYLSSGGDA